MSDLIREAPLGQIIRLLTRNKLYQYPEEKEGFQIPWPGFSDNKEEPEDEGLARESSEEIQREPSKKELEDTELGQQMTQDADMTEARLARTKTRETTAQWTEERFQVEQEEAITRTKSVVVVPTKTKDGVTLVDWYTTDDPDNPQNWSSLKKVYVCVLIFLYTFAVYSSSAIYTSAQEQVMERFDISYSRASLILSLYVIGYGVGPLLFSPLSEVPLFGRNAPYMVSFALFVILALPTALIDNYAGLLVLRFLTGFMGSPCLATGGATMQDMYSLLKLPYALSAWVAAAFCGPALGPLISGFAVQAENWRWPFWEILWLSGPIWLLWFFTMPETSAGNILLRRARRLRALTGNDKLLSQSEIDQGTKAFSTIVYEALLVPAIICVKDPAVLFTNAYSAFIYSIYYSFFEAFPLAYIGIYGFNIGELGIVFVCIVVSCLVGIAIYIAYQWYYLEPDIIKNGLRAQEHRLVPALFAVWLLPIALFWFGWTARASIHWIVSIIGITFFGIGAFVLFQCIFMYLPLTYPPYAASLFATNDAFRSLWAAGSIIYAHPMYVNLGLGRGTSILGGLAAGGGLGVIALWYFGAKLRAKSKFALS
ncbi:MAG: hypothetical protein M1820_005697 [Bogoriella megaspora]|nr:MAG: hypothetical protein M1820_005697 [Bogoriella megaspora]